MSQEEDDEGPVPQTTPLEATTVSPELSNTLQHIVGQLDILTQVCLGSHFMNFMLVQKCGVVTIYLYGYL